jgi:hypothetical protein
MLLQGQRFSLAAKKAAMVAVRVNNRRRQSSQYDIQSQGRNSYGPDEERAQNLTASTEQQLRAQNVSTNSLPQLSSIAHAKTWNLKQFANSLQTVCK